MFSNAITLKGNDIEEIFLKMVSSINECSSNYEEYVTFRFEDTQEIIIKSLETAFKKLHYNTFLCYHVYDDSDENRKEHWYLKISWGLRSKERKTIS